MTIDYEKLEQELNWVKIYDPELYRRVMKKMAEDTVNEERWTPINEQELNNGNPNTRV